MGKGRLSNLGGKKAPPFTSKNGDKKKKSKK